MDYYVVIGVARTANEVEIKKAYRRLAFQYHPDRNAGDKAAEDKFKEISKAYDVLSDPRKRSEYDRQGPSVKTHQPHNNPKPPKTKEDFEKEKAETKKNEKKPNSFWHDEPDSKQELDKVQCTFFGGGSTGRNVMVQMKLTPDEMQRGGKKYVTYKKRDMCKKCTGDGEDMKSCPRCQGLKPDIGWCPICDGQGALPAKCSRCKGDGVLSYKLHQVMVSFPPNVKTGHQITIVGEGEDAPRKPPGIVRVVVV